MKSQKLSAHRIGWASWLVFGWLMSALSAQAGAVLASDKSIDFHFETEYFPSPFVLNDGPRKRLISSIAIKGHVPELGDGRAEVQLDNRPAVLNSFGDVVSRTGPRPEVISVILRQVKPADTKLATTAFSEAIPQTKVFDVVFPDGLLAGQLRFVLSKRTFGSNRMLVIPANARPSPATQRNGLILLGSLAPREPLHDDPLGKKIDLEGYYVDLKDNLRLYETSVSADGADLLKAGLPKTMIECWNKN